MSTTLLMGYPGDGAARPTATTYQGDATTTLTFLMKTAAGAAIDLRGYDSAWLSASFDGSWPFDLAAMTIVNDATGTVTIVPTAPQVASAGLYQAKIRFVDGSAVTYSEPFNLRVLETGVNPAVGSMTWTEIRVYGRRGNDPVGESMTRWTIHVYNNTALLGTYRMGLILLAGTAHNTWSTLNVVSPGHSFTLSSAFWPRTFYYDQNLNFTVDFEDVTLANGQTISRYETGITIDSDLFTAAGQWYYFTPSTLTGTLTSADPPSDDYPEMESP
jgi:hypothetical protein